MTLANLEAAVAALPIAQGRILEQTVMHQVFSLVQDKADWRNPVNARVYADCCNFSDDLIACAVRFMTATEATITREGSFIVVKAKGYFAGPAY